MRCTPEMDFKALCCLDYTNFESYLTRAGPMTLQLAQVPNTNVNSGNPGPLQFIEDD